MKFKVREGFVVHDTKIVKVKQGSQEVKQPQTNTYYEGQEVDFDAATATEHLHKLEAADKKAEEFVAGLTVPDSTATQGLDHSAAISALTEQISNLTALVATMAGATAGANTAKTAG